MDKSKTAATSFANWWNKRKRPALALSARQEKFVCQPLLLSRKDAWLRNRELPRYRRCVLARFVLRELGRFGRTSSGFDFGRLGMSSGSARMIEAIRSLKSSTVSTGFIGQDLCKTERKNYQSLRGNPSATSWTAATTEWRRSRAMFQH